MKSRTIVLFYRPFIPFMKVTVFGLLLLLQVLSLSAQKKIQRFDFQFNPTTTTGRYHVETEKKDSLYFRQAWYLPELSQAMEGWYKDADGKIPHGEEIWFYDNKVLKSAGQFLNGKKHGDWLAFNNAGMVNDSGNYVDGRLKGIRMQWHDNGTLIDSMKFDGAGNGVQVGWYEDGVVSRAGFWEGDTLKRGRWKYYHNNGQVKATEDYVAGKLSALHCYDESGKELDPKLCGEKEAQFAGGDRNWSKFLQRHLDPSVPVKNGGPAGGFQVVVQFIVEKDGSVSNIKPVTKHGFGMEEEVVRIMKISPKWEPAQQFGKMVKAYRLQPVTFVVSEER